MILSHISLVVRDIRKSTEFYSSKLGLKVISAEPDKGLAKISFGKVELHLVDKLYAGGRPTGEFAFNFLLPDGSKIESEIAGLKEVGLNPVLGPIETRDGRTAVSYAGTDNERIEISSG